MTDVDSTEDSENKRNDKHTDTYYPPPQTSDREYQKPTNPQSNNLPMAPRQREMVDSFKKIIAQHLQDVGEKTTGEFLELVALDLWRETRRQ